MRDSEMWLRINEATRPRSVRDPRTRRRACMQIKAPGKCFSNRRQIFLTRMKSLSLLALAFAALASTAAADDVSIARTWRCAGSGSEGAHLHLAATYGRFAAPCGSARLNGFGAGRSAELAVIFNIILSTLGLECCRKAEAQLPRRRRRLTSVVDFGFVLQDGVLALTTDTFESHVGGSMPAFVEFYAPVSS
jgi:hypothetical protein